MIRFIPLFLLLSCNIETPSDYKGSPDDVVKRVIKVREYKIEKDQLQKIDTMKVLSRHCDSILALRNSFPVNSPSWKIWEDSNARFINQNIEIINRLKNSAKWNN